jgi:hypothetical protein
MRSTRDGFTVGGNPPSRDVSSDSRLPLRAVNASVTT